MKLYTVYDNIDGGFTILWNQYDKFNNRWLRKRMIVNSKETMFMWKRRLENDGYKFVGKL